MATMKDAVESTTNPKGLLAWFAGNTVTANLIMVFLIVGGLIIASRMNTDTFPEIDPGTISVSVPYPGATPSEVEDAITRRIEEAVTGIEGVKRVRSTASEGLGSIVLELRDFVDPQIIKDDVQSAVDQISQFPPQNAEDPQIVVAEAGSVMMRLAVFGDVPEFDLRRITREVEDDLLSVEGITLTALAGARSYEISIEVSEERLRQYQLSLSQVAEAVNAGSLNLSAGTLRTEGGEILLRTDVERKTGEAFEDIIIRSGQNGGQVLLGDIATIVDGFEDGQLKNSFNGVAAMFIDVSRSDDQDAFDISRAVTGFLESYELPPGIGVSVVTDNTTIIADRLNLMIRNGILGLALVFIFLSLTLDLRLAFWTSLGIPISFLGAFFIISQFVTLNMITMFGLIVVLGIVVDDAVVVGENIYQAQRDGYKGVDAALEGLRGVMVPVTIGVLTTMAAFAPLMFSTGLLGQIMFPVPVVVISVLLISLVDAFIILPAHLSHEGEWSRGAMAIVREKGHDVLAGFRDRIILPIVKLAVRARYVTLSAAFAILILTAGLLGSGTIRFVFFPAIESDQVIMTLEMPTGTAYASTAEVMARVEAAAFEAVGGKESDILQSFSMTIGAPSSSTNGGPPGQSNAIASLNAALGNATLTLVPSSTRSVSSSEIERKWREGIGTVAGAKSVSFVSSLAGGGADINLEFVHADSAALEIAVESAVAQIRALDGVTLVETSLESGKRQMSFTLSPEGIAAGLTSQDIALQMRQAFFGEDVQRIQRGRDEVRVYVRYPKEGRQNLSDLEDFRIRLASGKDVPLYTVATIEETLSPARINRVNSRRVETLDITIDDAVTTPGAVKAILNTELLPALAQYDSKLSYSYAGDTQDQSEDLQSLAFNLLIAIGIIFVMLASVLRSYIQPIIIISAIPLGACCAIFGHLIMGYDLSFLSLFGIVALSGVIINDSIVLMDYFNKQRAKDHISVHEAAILSARRRFRPILLTTLTTFIGLFPMLLETSLQAQFLIPMAISLGFGILFASFLIIIMVPAFLMIAEDARMLPERIMKSSARLTRRKA